MAYNIKDVFYLDVSATVTAGTAGGGTAQLELSAYIDPIARGKSKATGLAVYRVQWITSQDASMEPMDDAEVGSFRAGLLAGAGMGDNATGAITFSPQTQFRATNDLLVASYEWYGPRSMNSNASPTPTMYNELITTSTEVPYVIVRDNVVLAYDVGDNLTSDHNLSVRLSVSQINLDQSTLNQLLRTQTV
jgi:hypothetical protein